jgi:outer membrane receptor for ferrienterochelin and colicins
MNKLPLVLCLSLAFVTHAADLQMASLRAMSLSDLLEVDIGTGATPKTVRQTPAITYVITASDITRLGARNLLEVLQSVPGFFMYSVRAEVSEPVTDVRGGFSERGGYVLFLLDGRPLRLLDGVAFPEMLRLPMHHVARVEIVRGPASAMFGAEALTGAVNIITKKEANDLGASVGSFGQHAAWLGKSGTTSTVDWALAASYAKTQNDILNRSQRPRRDFTLSFERDYLDLSLKLHTGPWSVSFWGLNYAKTESGHPQNRAGITLTDSQHRHLELAWEEAVSERTRLKVNLLHTKFTNQTQNQLRRGVPTSFSGNERHIGADLTLTSAYADAHRLQLNVGLSQDDLLTAPAFVPRKNAHLLIQNEYAFAPNWELTLGGRFDHYNDIGGVRNPRLGLVWTSSPVLTTKLLWGEAFRPPPSNGTATNLAKPERINNIEIAFDFHPSDALRGALNLYHYRATDLLFVAPPPATIQTIPPGTLPPITVSSALASRTGRGGELEFTWLATPTLRLGGSLTVARVTDDLTGQQIAATPTRSAKASLDWDMGPTWAFNLRWESYWNRQRAVGDLRPALGTLQTLNTNVRHEIGSSTTLSFSIHNLLNNRAFMPVLSAGNTDDQQVSARNLSVQLETRF